MSKEVASAIHYSLQLRNGSHCACGPSLISTRTATTPISIRFLEMNIELVMVLKGGARLSKFAPFLSLRHFG